MSNFFDQFDDDDSNVAVSVDDKGVNFFDQFDDDDSTVITTQKDTKEEQNFFDQFDKKEEDEAGIVELGAGFGADIAISEGGRLAGASIGTAIAPGVGTFIGFVAGGLSSGAAGSIARQRIIDPDGDISWGQVLADSIINLIPGAKGGKSVASAVARQAGVGAGISGGAQVIEKQIDEGRLPTIEELTAAGLTGATLGAGLGITGEAFRKAYTKFGGMPSRSLTEAYRLNDDNAKILVDGIEMTSKQYRETLPKNFNDLKLGISEAYSDQGVRFRVLQDTVAGGQMKPGGILKVTNDGNDFYLQRRLAEGKINAKNEEVSNLVNLERQFLLRKEKELGIGADKLSEQVNQYLYAKHGVAYNKSLGDNAAGKTTKELNSIVKDFESRGLNKDLDFAIKNRKDLSKRILDTLVDGGLVSKAVAKDLRKKYPNYVPLNRIMDSDDSANIANKIFRTSSGRYEINSTGLRTAKGSEKNVRDISQNIIDNLVLATRRAETNKANQAFLKLIRSNKGTADAIAIEPVRKGKRGGGDPKFLMKQDDVLSIFENGQRKFLKIKDPKLAAALKGTNKEELGSILRGLQAYNRFLGGLYTRWNPEFAVPNIVRDRSEAFVNNMAKMSYGKAFSTLNPVRDVATTTRMILKRTPRNADERRMAAEFEEFVAAGGKTGGLGQSTLLEIEKRTSELSKSLNKPTKFRAKKFLQIMDGINEVLETSTRFGTYRRARADGLTKDQAALAARNSSFDPQLQGAQGDTIRALYLFSNPAIQGAKNFIRSMSKPKVYIPVGVGLVATTAAIDIYNQSIDPDYRKKIPQFKLDKHLTFVQGQNQDGSLRYVSIPIGYSMVPFKIMADKAQMMLRQGNTDKLDLKKEGSNLAKNILDSYNPMGGSPVPTVLRPVLELSRNKDGLGRDIRPKWLETQNISELEKIHPWTARTRGGELAMNFSEQLLDMGLEVSPENLLYLYQNYTGGPGTSVKRLFNLTSKLWNGEKLQPAEIPIARRFYGQTYAQAFENRTGRTQSLREIEKQEGTKSAKSRRISSNYQNDLKNAKNQSERTLIIRNMLQDPEADESVFRRVDQYLKDEAAGITPQDRRLKSSSKTVRARYLGERLKELDRQQSSAYLQEMRQKKILTDSVMELMIEQESFKEAFSK